MEKFRELYGQEAMDKLNLALIPPENIELTPAILKQRP